MAGIIYQKKQPASGLWWDLQCKNERLRMSPRISLLQIIPLLFGVELKGLLMRNQEGAGSKGRTNEIFSPPFQTKNLCCTIISDYDLGDPNSYPTFVMEVHCSQMGQWPPELEWTGTAWKKHGGEWPDAPNPTQAEPRSNCPNGGWPLIWELLLVSSL